MARIEVRTCDRCGRTSNPVDHWSEAIVKITVHCPPDGINLGKHEPDLCYSCRRQLDGMVSKFLSDNEKHERQI